MNFQITSTQLSALYLYNQQFPEMSNAFRARWWNYRSTHLSTNINCVVIYHYSSLIFLIIAKKYFEKNYKNTNLTRACVSCFWSKDRHSQNKSEQEWLKNSGLQSKGQPLLFRLSWFLSICVCSTGSTFSILQEEQVREYFNRPDLINFNFL